MEILLIEPEKVTRDHIKVGLMCFHDIQVEVAEGFSAINRARQKNYDYIMISHNPGDHDGLGKLKNLREFDKETQVVVITTAKHVKTVANERSRLHIYSTLTKPLEMREFFRLVARMRERVPARV